MWIQNGFWLSRAGSHGKYERMFIQEKRVYQTWDSLNVDLAKLTDKLLGAVSKFQANEGLFVSWGGFKSILQKELAPVSSG